MDGGNFWELHRKLAECYVFDTQTQFSKVGTLPQAGVGMVPPPQMHLPRSSAGDTSVVSFERRPSASPVGILDPRTSGSVRSQMAAIGHKASLTSSALRRGESFDSALSDGKGFDQVVPHDESVSTAVAKASLHQRRRSTVECLLNVQGLDEGVVKSGDDLDITRIELKPHEFWARPLEGHGVMSWRRLNQERALYSGGTEGQLGSEMPLDRTWAIIHPGGTFRLAWNVLVALCLVHDLVVIPLYVFDIPDSLALLISLEWCTQLFWNVDIFLSMRTGYYYKGLLIMNSRKIFRNYVRTWMALDVTLVSLDWIFVIMELSGIQVTSVAQLSRTIRFLRFLRLVRILRWVKLRRMAEVFQELIQSQSAGMYWSLLFGIARLLILNHLVACAWFGLGRIQGDENWIVFNNLANKTAFHQYWTCLNWAFAQLGVGLSEINPLTTLEVFFSVIIAFRSLITCTTLISRMTSLMTALIKTKEDEEREFRLLRSYLVYNEIPLSLGQKVTRFLQHQFNLRMQAKSADVHVPLLDLLSHRLQGELQFARHQKSLYQLEFLDHLMHEQDLQIVHALQELSMKAIFSMPVAARDIIFLGGNFAGKSYLILSGEFVYYHEKGKVILENEAGWIAEMCLWTPWVYLGDLLAQDVSRIVYLDAAVFGSIISQCQPAQESAKEYSRHFIAGMRRKRYWTDLVSDELSSEDENDSSSAVGKLASLGKGKPKAPKASWGCFRSLWFHKVHSEPASRAPSQ